MKGVGVFIGYIKTARNVEIDASIVNIKVNVFINLLLLICSVLDK